MTFPAVAEPRRWQRWLVVATGVYALVALAVMVVNSYTNPLGNFDFHLFWYNGHFLWQGRDPYAAYAMGARPTPPFHYLDGVTVQGDPAQPGLHTIPTNSAPVLFLLMPLARFSWLPAKGLWLAANTLLMLAAPWLTFRAAARYGVRLERWQQWAVAVGFWAMAAPRYAVGYGQSTLLVYNGMMLSLRALPEHPTRSGAWLGLALSKISIAFPLLLIALWWRRWRVVLVALGLQLLGLFAISVMDGTPPWHVAGYYVQNALEHSDTAGVHVGSLYNRSPLFRALAPVALTCLLLYGLWRSRARLQLGELARGTARPLHFSLVAIGLLWGLLAFYHRMYDGVLLLPFLILLAWAGHRMDPRRARRLYGYGMALVALLALPVPLYEWLFGGGWQKVFNTTWTLLFCSALAVAVTILPGSSRHAL